ncbi:MAG TPA: site-specific DNA-methyltransferase [bacterium]|nr:site-specific DNA-methyltransferase [bacterium]
MNLHQGDSLEVLKTIDSESIDMCITSPPYWGLRDYGSPGQLGLEPTFQEYIIKLVVIFAEIKRVLKSTGTCWVNIGDTYSNSSQSGGGDPTIKTRNLGNKSYPKREMSGVSAKSLIGIPARFSIAMIDELWILRNEIIWHKPNAMPASVKDRFTVDFEKMFFFTKSKKYYFEQQKEPATSTDTSNRNRDETKLNNTPGRTRMGGLKTNHYIDKNKRTIWNDPTGIIVWKIPTKPYKGAHFAVYPEELIRTPILAGCPEGSIVIDPFMGSGTTLKVANDLGRKGIGIELNPEYIELAKKRIDIKQGQLF